MEVHVVLFAGWRPQKAPHILPHLRNSQRPHKIMGGFTGNLIRIRAKIGDVGGTGPHIPYLIA
jgi:hypothetical protein